MADRRAHIKTEDSGLDWKYIAAAVVGLGLIGAVAFFMAASGPDGDDLKGAKAEKKGAKVSARLSAHARKIPVESDPEAPSDFAKDKSSGGGLDLGDIVEAGASASAGISFDDDGAVSKESLLLLLRDLTRRIKERRDELAQAVKEGVMDSSEFESELGKAIPEIEARVNEEYGLGPDPVFKAQTKYSEDADVVAVSRELRNTALPDFAAKAMGEMEDILGGAGTVPEDMTAEKVAELTRENATTTIEKMKLLVDEVKASGKTGSEALEEFQKRFIERAKSLTMETFESLGISAEDYAASMMKFMESPEVQTAQMETQQRLMLAQQLNMMQLSSGMSRNEALGAMGIPTEMAAML